MRLKRQDGGAIAILVAILAVVLFAFAAIVVDLGYARTVEGEAQNAVDASALAAAGVLADKTNPSAPFSEATKAITDLAASNFGTDSTAWINCSATKPSPAWVRGSIDTNCILFNRSVNPTLVQVVLPPRHVDSFFGGLVGYGGIDVGARAQATIRQDDVPGCAVCVQNQLDARGPLDIDPYSPGSPVGSFSASTGLLHPGGSITVADPGAITFESTPTPAGGASYSSRPIIRSVKDPFAGAGHPMPAGPGTFPDPVLKRTVMCGPDSSDDVASLGPGVYRGITVTGVCPATGVIVVTRLLHVESGGSLTASLAAIQLSCGRVRDPGCRSPTNGAMLQVDAGGQLTMSASFPSEFSVVAEPDNTSPMTINGDLSADQAVYGWSTAVTLGPGATLTAFGRVSVGRLIVGSGGAVTVQAAGGEPVAGPPMVGLYR